MSETAKSTVNMHKVIYLANEYPGSKMQQFFKMFQMPLLEFQSAAYLAEDSGFMAVVKKKKSDDRFEVLKLPETWEFGDEVREMINTLTYVFKRLETQQIDLSEEELNAWMEGYPTHDQFIAVKWLLNEGVLGTYNITISNKELKLPDTVRPFYCIAGNEAKRWGEKQIPDKKRIIA